MCGGGSKEVWGGQGGEKCFLSTGRSDRLVIDVRQDGVWSADLWDSES